VVLLLVQFGGRKSSTKWSFEYGGTVTCYVKTIWRSKIVHQIGVRVQSCCYLLCQAYLKIKNHTQNSNVRTVIPLLVL
jgi:hypothetical protein